jgi:hypothetical protein
MKALLRASIALLLRKAGPMPNLYRDPSCTSGASRRLKVSKAPFAWDLSWALRTWLFRRIYL